MKISELFKTISLYYTDGTIKWHKGNFAQDISGQYTYPLAQDAVSFCAHGAVKRFAPSLLTGDECEQDARDYLTRAIQVIDNDEEVTIASFNDNPKTELKDILRLYNLAADLAIIDGN